jgi:hypothetical protein
MYCCVTVPSKSTVIRKQKTLKKIVFVGVLNLKDDNYRIRNYWSEERIRGSGSVPKYHGCTTPVATSYHHIHQYLVSQHLIF